MFRVALPLLLLALPAAAQTKYAVVVGANTYTDKKLPDLAYAEADAKRLGGVLTDAGFKVTLLLGKEATKAKVEAAFDAILTKATKEDTLLFVFAGHGQQFKPKGEDKDAPFLCTPDCDALKADTQVPLNALLEKAGNAKVGKALFLLDACRTDPSRGGGITGNAVSVKAQTEVLFAASDGQKAREHADAGGKGKGHGLFMAEVIAAFDGAAKNKKGQVTWDGLTAHIKSEVTDKSKTLFPAIEDNQHQVPHKMGSLAGDVVMIAAKAGADRKAGEEVEYEVADGVKMVFCWVPPGECQLGSPKAEREAVLKLTGDKEEPDWLKAEAEGVRGKYATKAGFWMAKYPTTQEQWTAVMGTTPFYYHAKGDGNEKVKELDTSRFPAERVSWEDAQEFLKGVNKRGGVAKVFGGAGSFKLPHEDEWEYACRGGKGNKQPFYWGDTLNGTEANCDGNYPFGTTTKGDFLKRPTAVGSYAKAAPHPWGLCDMSGNVWQWCDNKYSNDYNRVLRGGSWINDSHFCRSAFRYWVEPSTRDSSFGFRLCFPLDK